MLCVLFRSLMAFLLPSSRRKRDGRKESGRKSLMGPSSFVVIAWIKGSWTQGQMEFVIQLSPFFTQFRRQTHNTPTDSSTTLPGWLKWRKLNTASSYQYCYWSDFIFFLSCSYIDPMWLFATFLHFSGSVSGVMWANYLRRTGSRPKWRRMLLWSQVFWVQIPVPPWFHCVVSKQSI